jgi:hydroxyacylglutathione hydrolase
MNLVALPAFSDNYIWMLHDGHSALVVDPGESAPVLRALDEHSLKLAAIVVTHHHHDHVGGIEALLPRLQADGGGPVLGPATERIPHRTRALHGGDSVDLLGIRFDVIDVPGHTAGHIAYLGQPAGQAPILFCGDTLFEGTPAQMHASLSALAALPAASRVCCAHEYTLSNLKFARAVEPGSADVVDELARCEALRARSLPTLPSSIGRERLTNPFLRCDQPAVIAAARHAGAASAAPVDVFAALRAWKNNF